MVMVVNDGLLLVIPLPCASESTTKCSSNVSLSSKRLSMDAIMTTTFLVSLEPNFTKPGMMA